MLYPLGSGASVEPPLGTARSRRSSDAIGWQRIDSRDFLPPARRGKGRLALNCLARGAPLALALNPVAFLALARVSRLRACEYWVFRMT